MRICCGLLTAAPRPIDTAYDYEDIVSCPQDCAPVCGDGYCDSRRGEVGALLQSLDTELPHALVICWLGCAAPKHEYVCVSSSLWEAEQCRTLWGLCTCGGQAVSTMSIATAHCCHSSLPDNKQHPRSQSWAPWH
jgi:hypothetical protein